MNAKATYTGIITRYDKVVTDAIDYNYTQKYRPNTEFYSVCYNVELLLDDGVKVWFYTPKLEYRITTVGGYAIATYDDKPYDWATITQTKAQSNAIEQTLVPSFVIGEKITVVGRVKKQYGNKGIAMNYVKLVK